MSALYRSILVTALAAAGVLALSACGQKGDLYLPPASRAQAPRTSAPQAPAVTASQAAPASAPAARP